MATEKTQSRTGHNPLTRGLAFLAGTGMTMMMVALALGVINGASADSGTMGLLFTAGMLAFIIGAAAWGAIERPWDHFDDINEPHYHGHHEDHE